LRWFLAVHTITASVISDDLAMRTIVDLPSEQIEHLKVLSGRSRLSRSELVRCAVAEYLQRHGQAQADVAFGVWRDAPRDALAYERAIRDEWGL
jgi:hypothetical protein